MSSKLLLVDAYSMIYRAFFAIRNLTAPDGSPVNALYGFTKMLRKQLATHRPSHAAVVFDLGAPHKRLEVLPSYKAQRAATPPDLELQLPAIRTVLAAMRIPVVEVDGEEADDVIATLATQASNTGMSVLIASNDKDLAQLVDDHVKLLRPGEKEEVIFDAAAVQAKHGVPPTGIVDLLSLTGDAVDNIGGVPGAGEKRALELLNQFGSTEALIANAAQITRPKLREAVMASAETIRRNRALLTLSRDLPVATPVHALKLGRPDYGSLLAELRRHGFRSLVAEIERESGQTDDLFSRLG